MPQQELLSPSASEPAALVPAGPALPARAGGMSLRGFTDQPAVRKSLPLLGLVGALGLAGATWWAFQSPAQRTIFEGLTDADKGAVVNALQSAGMNYQIDPATGAVQVADNKLHDARILLASQGLPKAVPAGDALIDSIPMGSSRAVEGETLRGAREADLARTIEAIDPVKTARVHLAEAEASPFVRDAAPAAASVMLTLENGRSLSEVQVRAIRHLVSGMAPERVSVVDQSGELLSQDGNGDDRNFRLQMQAEDRYRQAVNTLLAPIVGAGNFSAEVHADMDVSESQATRETYPKDDRALRSEQINKTTSSTSTANAIGIPGALSNQPPPASQLTTTPANGAAPAAPQANGESAETANRSYDVGREISVTHQPQGRLRRLSVAVAVRQPRGQKALTPAEIASLESLVKGAVGFDQARGDVVVVTSRPFAAVAEPEINWWDSPWILPIARQVGALLAALLTYFLLARPLLRILRERAAAPVAEEKEPESEEVSQATNDQFDQAAPNAEKVTLEMIERAPSYEARANLVRNFVQQNPERATRVVQQLMERGNAR
jgi:flagellar M-ring protein FliF